MASLKKLAGQTAWYGISSIAARFLNYLLTPYLTRTLSEATYGEMSIMYAAIPFLNVVFTYGMETTFFRYSNANNDSKKVFSTGCMSLISSTILLSGILLCFRQFFANLLNLDNHPEFITWAVWVIALDTFSTLPFAKLRNDNRPRKYAFIKVVSILINIGFVFFFYTMLPGLAQKYPTSIFANWYSPSIGAGYYIIANIISSGFILLLLIPEILSIKLEWDSKLWRQMIIYSLPLIIVGFGGVINETFDRIMLGKWSSFPTHEQKMQEVGIYSACYKLSILITLFVQAFRLGAEPFFFHAAKGENAPKTYARVMKFFVITVCIMFLFVMFYMDIFKYFLSPHYWVGLIVVPILLLANMSLGVYYNLSIWYKLSHKTTAGATITIIGAAITLLINYFFIPIFSYIACAWATMICYSTMMLISFFWGQRVYPVPYNTKKMLGYFGLMMLLYGIYVFIALFVHNILIHIATGTLLLIVYLRFVLKVEKKDLVRLPYIGRFAR